jgi:hypothetical protein
MLECLNCPVAKGVLTNRTQQSAGNRALRDCGTM